jgi:hypothetical protein
MLISFRRLKVASWCRSAGSRSSPDVQGSSLHRGASSASRVGSTSPSPALGYNNGVGAVLAKPQADKNDASRERGAAVADRGGQWSANKLSTAAHHGKLSNVQTLLQDARTDVNSVVSKRGGTSLVAAAAKGRLAVVQALLADARTDVNKANNAGFTPIASAAGKGHLSVVNALLADPRTGVNVPGGITPLTAAAAQGQLDIV